jgi:hypothetical protein
MQSNNKIYTTLDEVYKLTYSDYLLLETIRDNAFDEAAFFDRLSANCNLAFIARITKASPYLKNLLSQEKYNNLWNLEYAKFGYALSNSHFLAHENVNKLDLLLGAFLFHKSTLARQEIKQDFFYSEVQLLEEAIKFNSVHATQKYNEYLYWQVEIQSSKIQSNDELFDQKELLVEAIKNCKKLLRLYGSYAYMMLAEAYFNYARWTGDISDTNMIRTTIEAAVNACDHAERHLEKSIYSIHNASLGQGLQASNSFKIDNPAHAKEQIQNWLQELLNTAPSYCNAYR